jgi:hypothetical protein
LLYRWASMPSISAKSLACSKCNDRSARNRFAKRHNSPLASNPRTIWQPDYPQEVTAPVNKHAYWSHTRPPPALIVGSYRYLDGPCSGPHYA